MDNGKKKSLEQTEAMIERARNKLSKQPRFNTDAKGFFFSTYQWGKQAFMAMPPYKSDSRRRDEWLRQFWPQEPHLAGVLNSVIAIDKNRGWSLTGGRNQVMRYTDILHASENGSGWRVLMDKQSNSYYTADIGAIAETGRDGKRGPLRALFHVDPARCKLTGSVEQPLEYTSTLTGSTTQRWTDSDFFRVRSQGSTDERMNDLGFCALSRCVALAQIMIAVYEHDQEKLGARAPKGLLLLQNITQDQWDDAMAARDAQLSNKEREYYGGVAVLAQMGVDQIDAKLVGLSQLPDGFDFRVFTDLLMYGYALAFGYDPSEFWPVQFGSLGRGTEAEVQHSKATGKGGLDFALAYQERLQLELPDTLTFEYEQRDAEGERLDAEVALAKADVVTKLYESGLAQGAPLLDREEARSLLAEAGLIPREWTEIEEESESTDTEETRVKALRERAMDDSRTRTAIMRYPDEPIVRVEWPTGRELVLWERGSDAVKRRVWVVDRDII